MPEGNPAYARVPVESGEVRHTGITTIGDVPWGTHFCQFYQDEQELIDTLVPYFKAGLENNEFCIWVTSEPLRAAEAKGMLDRAKSYLLQVLEALRPEITAGTPVVVLEPGCASVFRDEIKNLLPADEDAKRLARQTFLFSEFLESKAPDWKPPKVSRKAVMHGHCLKSR